MSLEIRITKYGDIVNLSLDGNLTLGPQLRQLSQKAEGLLTESKPRALFLDMAAVKMLDSAGLGELMILYTNAGQRNCHLCLLHAPQHIVKLLEVTKLSEILRCFPDHATASQWLASH